MCFFCLHTNKKQLGVFIQFWCTTPVIKSLLMAWGLAVAGVGRGWEEKLRPRSGEGGSWKHLWVGRGRGRAQGGSGQDVWVQCSTCSRLTAGAGSPEGRGAGGRRSLWGCGWEHALGNVKGCASWHTWTTSTQKRHNWSVPGCCCSDSDTHLCLDASTRPPEPWAPPASIRVCCPGLLFPCPSPGRLTACCWRQCRFWPSHPQLVSVPPPLGAAPREAGWGRGPAQALPASTAQHQAGAARCALCHHMHSLPPGLQLPLPHALV